MIRLVPSLVVVCFVFGCGTGEGGKCAKATDCASGLTCSPHDWTCQTPAAITAAAKTAAETSAAACRKGAACREYGECTADNGKCIAVTQADCSNSTRCTSNYMACKLYRRRCVRLTGADRRAERERREAVSVRRSEYNRAVQIYGQEKADATCLCPKGGPIVTPYVPLQ